MIADVVKAEMDDIELLDIIDGQMLGQVIEDQGVLKATIRRFLHHCDAAVDAGADMILSSCSTMGDAAEIAAELYDIPVVRIDDAMIREAVNNFSRIAVLASQPMTISPTVRLIEKIAEECDKKVEIIPAVAQGAFAAAMNGNGPGHDDLIIETAKSLTNVEVIVLAQASMMRVQERVIAETGKTVLSSPALCAKQIKRARFE